MTHLNSEQVRIISANPPPDPPVTPFLKYCSVYWGVHAKRELSEYAKSLALLLLQEYDGHISAKLLLKQHDLLELLALDADFGTGFPFSGLHCASYLGIIEVVITLIEMEGYDINEGDPWGHTPLAWAAHSGHEEVVKVLLSQEEVNPDKPNYCHETPLTIAAQMGHEEVARILLGRGEVNPDKTDCRGRTPLS